MRRISPKRGLTFALVLPAPEVTDTSDDDAGLDSDGASACCIHIHDTRSEALLEALCR